MTIQKIFYAAFLQFLIVGTVFSNPENPSFKDGILNIDSVGSVTQAGEYQDVRFQLTEQGEWKLLDYKQRSLIPKVDDSGGLHTVELITTDALPIQAFLKVSAAFTMGCDDIGNVRQRLLGNTFEVSVYITDPAIDEDGEPMSCTQGFVNPSVIIELPVYGLPEGEYTYNVNGEFSGTFNLTSDNALIGY